MDVFNALNFPIQLVVLDIISLIAAAGLGYYAARMFFHLRWGRLEKGWRLMTFGAVVLAVGYAFITAEDAFLAYSIYYMAADYVGTIMSSIGIALIMLGIRAQYLEWTRRVVSVRARK
ncbi:MAG TPA: hypothetical protein VFF30_13090 [Nitrososphaerales archaeon]|nr:hypothetical protein [Nitrososphaerales archaeon]